jgi:hypothetical protein
MVQMSTDRGAFGGTPPPLAAPAQMPREPLTDVGVDLSEGSPAVARSEVVGPTAQVPVEFADQVGQRLEATPMVNEPSQLLALTRHSLGRGLHIPVTQLSSMSILIQPEAVTKEVQGGTLLAQVHHPGFLPVDFQPQPILDLLLDELAQVFTRGASQHHEVIGIAHQSGSDPAGGPSLAWNTWSNQCR